MKKLLVCKSISTSLTEDAILLLLKEAKVRILNDQIYGQVGFHFHFFFRSNHLQRVRTLFPDSKIWVKRAQANRLNNQ